MEPDVTETKKEVSDWRKNKKVRLAIIIGLIILVAILWFAGIAKKWMLAIGAMLLLVLGMEAANTDVDLGTLIETGSVEESMLQRDEDGNILSTDDGNVMTRIWRDENGFEVPEGTAGAKGEDEYNCEDFATQGEAQRFFDNAGGVANDVNRLDGNKDGVPCQALPAG